MTRAAPSRSRPVEGHVQEGSEAFGYRGGGVCDGSISLWEISYFKCVRNFSLNFFNLSMIRNAWPCLSQSWGIALVPKGATTSAPAFWTHCLVFFEAGLLSLPIADMKAETDTEIDATDKMSLEMLGTKKKRDQFQNLEGKSQHLCSQLHVRKQFLMGFLCAVVFLWPCLCMTKTISS